MKVHELISFLYTLDQDLEVVLPGYEGGYSSVRGITEPCEYVCDVNEAWYYGSHEQLAHQIEYGDITLEEAKQKGIFKGVMIF